MAETTKKATSNKKEDKKEDKKNNNNKNIIIGICCGIALVIVIVLAIVFAKGGLNDSYFVSDGTKYVLTIESDAYDTNSEDEPYTPIKTHLVYTYEGETITGLKTYYEYADGNAAKTAFEEMKKAAESEGQELGQIEVNGKYVIETAEEDAYKDMTASDVKEQIEFMEMLKNMNTDGDSEDAEETETVETEDEE